MEVVSFYLSQNISIALASFTDSLVHTLTIKMAQWKGNIDILLKLVSLFYLMHKWLRGIRRMKMMEWLRGMETEKGI